MSLLQQVSRVASRIARGSSAVLVNTVGELQVKLASTKSMYLGYSTTQSTVYGTAVLQIDNRPSQGAPSAGAGISIIGEGGSGTLIATHIATSGNVLYVSCDNPWYFSYNNNDPYGEVSIKTAIVKNSASVADRFTIGAGTAGGSGWIKSLERHVFRYPGSGTKDLWQAVASGYDVIGDAGGSSVLARCRYDGLIDVTAKSIAIMQGNGAPTDALWASAPPNGTLYSRADGSAGTFLYRRRANAWEAIA